VRREICNVWVVRGVVTQKEARSHNAEGTESQNMRVQKGGSNFAKEQEREMFGIQ